VSRRQHPGKAVAPAAQPAATTPVASAPPAAGWTSVLLVSAVAVAASVAGIGNAFAYDDIAMIELNPRLHGLAHWREILTSPYWPPPWQEEHYRPFTSLFFGLQYLIGAGSPVAFRITSYLLYAACSVGVFILGLRLLPRAVALGVAILFAAHPVHVEVVAPAVGQSEMIVALCALLMVVRYLDRLRNGALSGRDWAYLGVLYVIASLAKEHGLTLPAFLLAVELLLVRGTVRDRLPHLWPGYVALAGLAAVLVAIRFAVIGGEFSANWVAEALDGLTFGERALTMLMVVPEWARLLVWPAHLRLDYAPQEFVASTTFGGREALGLALVLLTAAALAVSWRKLPAAAFGIAWMAIALAPVSNILVPTGSLLAERLLFLPSIGFLLAVGAGVGTLWHRALSEPAWRRQVLGGAAGLLAVLGILRSAERQRVWRNEAYLSVRAVQDAPRSYRTQRAYADILFQLNRPEMAWEAYQRSIELAPPGHVWRVRNDLAARLRERGERQLEAEVLRASLEVEPAQPETRGHLVAALLALGRYDEAIAESDRALELGGSRDAFAGLKALADSARSAGAPPGSVQIRLQTGPRRR
jgi:tetratricopeptide (TPR) repeat protein